MKRILFFGLLLGALITGCKKDTVKVIPIQGKWIEESVVTKEYEMNSLVSTRTDPGNGATVDFRSDGTLVIINSSGESQTLPYSMQADSKVNINGAIYQITNLTSSIATLFTRTDYSAGYYDEVMISLKK